MKQRNDFGSFLDQRLYPELFTKMDTAFPEFGFKGKGDYWIATQDPPGYEKAKNHVYVYQNTPFGFKDQRTDNFIPLIEYIAGIPKPRGELFMNTVKELTRRAGLSFPDTTGIKTQPDEVKQTVHEEVPIKDGEILYTYKQIDRTPALKVVRKPLPPKKPGGEPGKTFLQWGPSEDGKGWIPTIKHIKTLFPLYALKGINSTPELPIIFHEGEKAVHYAYESKLPGCHTTIAGGSSSPIDKFDFSPVKGREVILCPDNDDPGEKYIQRIGSQCQKAGVKSLRVLRLPDIPEKGDIVEWVNLGGTPEGFKDSIEKAEPYHAPKEDISLWESPIPFNTTQVEPFPVEVLPSLLQSIVSEVSETVQVPVDLPAMISLSACAVPLARKLEIKVRGDHVEPLNLYTLTILESGNRKSATFRELTQPLFDWEQAERERLGPEIEEEQQKYRIQENRLKLLEGKASKEDDKMEREVLIREARDLQEEMERPRTFPRILADDITQERLSTLMFENNQRMAILSAEGDFFDSLGRYDKNGKANIGLLIKSHCGDSWSGDRMTRENSMDNPALTLGLLGQKEILRGLMERPSFKGRGLLARFLYSIPKSSVGDRGYQENSISEMTKRTYMSMVERLFSLPWSGTPEKREPHILTLSEETFREWLIFYNQVEKDLAPGGPLDWLADWGSKLPGQVVRIAGIFHCVSVETSSPWEVPVSVETMLSAVTIGHYLRSHVVAAFREMGADKSEGEAQAILAWIERKGIEQFKAGEVLGSLSRFHNMKELDPTLTLLQERNYIREVPQERKGKTGRQPAPLYEVNPYILNTTSKTSNTSKRDG